MGGGTFSVTNYATRSVDNDYANKSTAEVFTQRNINNAMNPYGIKVRESRDSAEHPNSIAIILGLDVTGSMGSIPHHLVKEGLPTMMGEILQNGVADPQVLFLGLGDHECDSSPLQVGQFESSDELLEKWLTTVYLEGGGGGNDGESYLLAWYFAANHTSIDCWEKRGQKGYLFTIGDEPVLRTLPKKALKGIMGDGQYSDYTATSLFEAASAKYETYHIHVKETYSGGRKQVIDGWRQLLKDHLLVVEKYSDIPRLIANTIRPATTQSISEVEERIPSKTVEEIL